MEKLIIKLESKWGCFKQEKNYLTQCELVFGDSKSNLNVLFNSIDIEEYNFAKKVLDCEFPLSLIKFYEKYNGLMLFSESLRIYGVETNDKDIYCSYDIVEQNEFDDIKSYGSKFKNYIVFGCYSSCLFCFDKCNLEHLYVFDTNSQNIIHQFSNINDLLSYYVDYLLEEYDTNGKKINYDKQLEGLPISNLSLEII